MKNSLLGTIIGLITGAADTVIFVHVIDDLHAYSLDRLVDAVMMKKSVLGTSIHELPPVKNGRPLHK